MILKQIVYKIYEQKRVLTWTRVPSLAMQVQSSG